MRRLLTRLLLAAVLVLVGYQTWEMVQIHYRVGFLLGETPNALGIAQLLVFPTLVAAFVVWLALQPPPAFQGQFGGGLFRREGDRLLIRRWPLRKKIAPSEDAALRLMRTRNWLFVPLIAVEVGLILGFAAMGYSLITPLKLLGPSVLFMVVGFTVYSFWYTRHWERV